MSAAAGGCALDNDEASTAANTKRPPGLLGRLAGRVIEEFNAQDGNRPSPCDASEAEALKVPLLKGPGEEGTGLVVREIFSAVTMFLPTLASFAVLRERQSSGAWSCFMCGWVLLAGFAAHMAASVSYHSACALSIYRPGIDLQPWRCLDQSFIFIGCITSAWALSQSAVYVIFIVLPFSAYAVMRLWAPSGAELRHHRVQRVGIGIIMYLAPMAARGDFWRLCACIACAGLFTIFFVADQLLAGWGHGLMHLALAPYGCLLMSSALAVRA
mmetsp:Transcript_132000/g.320785  ORF Transcript_132000/g.320785 Transcript_132000/m.320785 type:complete len:271 (+) Transcript_132000:67-879(+)